MGETTRLPSPLISFLVVVRNERRHIERCLRSMLAQTLSPDRYEVIVVDGMSTDGSREIIQRIIAEHAGRAIRGFDNPGLILSTGWNIGIREARGTYVVRPDAHAIVSDDFLERSLSVMQAHPEACAVGGMIETLGEGFWGEVIAKVLSSRVGVGGSLFRTGGRTGPSDTVVFGLYRRADLLDVGGFDESLRVNQDVVCHAKLRAQGKILYFDPTIRSVYCCRHSLAALVRQYFRVGRWVILARKHMAAGRLPLRYLAPFVFVLGIAALLVGGLWFQWMNHLLLTLLLIYALIGWTAAARQRTGLGKMLAFPVAMLALHVSYGLGELIGIVRYPFHSPINARRAPTISDN